MDYQVLFNIAVAIAGTAGGWVLGRITHALDQLDNDVRQMPEKYVAKADYNGDIKSLRDDLKRGLERIYDKLDGKADK